MFFIGSFPEIKRTLKLNIRLHDKLIRVIGRCDESCIAIRELLHWSRLLLLTVTLHLHTMAWKWF